MGIFKITKKISCVTFISTIDGLIYHHTALAIENRSAAINQKCTDIMIHWLHHHNHWEKLNCQAMVPN